MEVTKKDLIGEIEGLPIEVVKKMLERQVEQGNEENIEVFQNYRTCMKSMGGFNWDDTIEKGEFWKAVLCYDLFSLFFQKHPKVNKLETKETIIIGGIKYDKEEVEYALKDIKPIK